MLQIDMAATVRQNFGKEKMRSLRQEGRTPAILYGPKTDPLAMSLETKGFTKALLFLHGQNAVFTLDVEGGKSKKKRHVLLKEIQKDPVRGTVVHADFYEINLKESLTLPVPLKFLGTPKGVDMGGVVNIQMPSVLMKGLPLNMPDEIEIDITELELGGPGVTCGDLPLPENAELLEDGESVCASVVHPAKIDEPEVAVEEEGGEEEGAAPPEGEEAAAASEPQASAEEDKS